MITELGGAVAVPSAVRSSDSTTTMRVNDVIMMRIDGASDSTVSSAISWIARSVTPPLPPPRLMLMSCASGRRCQRPAAIRVRNKENSTREGRRSHEGTSDGQASRPSRLRDFRSWSSARRVSRAAAGDRRGLRRGARRPAAARRDRRRTIARLGRLAAGRRKRGFEPLRHLGEILVRARGGAAAARRRRRGGGARRRSARLGGGAFGGRRGAGARHQGLAARLRRTRARRPARGAVRRAARRVALDAAELGGKSGERIAAALALGGGGGAGATSSAKDGRAGRGGGSGICGSACGSPDRHRPSCGIRQAAQFRRRLGCRRGRCAQLVARRLARTMLGSTTMSVGPPIIRRCSTLSRRTSTSRRRPSTAAASITARRGMRPRLVLAPRRLPANRRTSQAAAPISARTTRRAKKNVQVSASLVPGQSRVNEVQRRAYAASTAST